MDDFPNQPGSEDSDQLRRRIEALEDQISTYERLLEELPDLFERKFQQRLEPLLERYRLLENSVRAEEKSRRYEQIIIAYAKPA